jgi:hypothetical protein
LNRHSNKENLSDILVFPAYSPEGSATRVFSGLVRKMIVRLEQQPAIENRQNYPAKIVDQLGRLLVEGVSAQQDTRRMNFYDIEHADRVFFIYLSPLTGRVILLATWRLLASPFINFDVAVEVA